MKLFKYSIYSVILGFVLFLIFFKINIFAQCGFLLCDKPITAAVIEQGVVDCFDEGLRNARSDSVSCEPSAVVYSKNKLYFASDKEIPSKSPVFYIPYIDSLYKDNINFLMNEELINAIKYEDLTITNDGKFIIATTAFDRINVDHSWDKYNKLVYWEVNNDDSVHVVSPSEYNNVKSSVLLRKYFAHALANDSFPSGMPYFKIEGLMCLPGNKLLFGVRETGKKYDDFHYRITIIATEFTINNKIIELDTNFKVVYDYRSSESTDIYNPVALSSIEYDRFNKRIYFLTSFEIMKSKKTVGGYLWILSMENFKKNKPPKLVTRKDGTPLLFNHKPDGVAVIDKKTVFIVCDDDRVTGKSEIYIPEMQLPRKLNQFAYYIVQFE